MLPPGRPACPPPACNSGSPGHAGHPPPFFLFYVYSIAASTTTWHAGHARDAALWLCTPPRRTRRTRPRRCPLVAAPPPPPRFGSATPPPRFGLLLCFYLYFSILFYSIVLFYCCPSTTTRHAGHARDAALSVLSPSRPAHPRLLTAGPRDTPDTLDTPATPPPGCHSLPAPMALHPPPFLRVETLAMSPDTPATPPFRCYHHIGLHAHPRPVTAGRRDTPDTPPPLSILFLFYCCSPPGTPDTPATPPFPPPPRFGSAPTTPPGHAGHARDAVPPPFKVWLCNPPLFPGRDSCCVSIYICRFHSILLLPQHDHPARRTRPRRRPFGATT